MTLAHIPPSHIALPLLYADQHLLVLNKPADLLSVPGKTQTDCLSHRVQAQFADALVVHRLDMATSGLLVMARGAAMQRLLSQCFAQRLVHKRYIALVQGSLHAESVARLAADTSASVRSVIAGERHMPAPIAIQADAHIAPACIASGWQSIDVPLIVDWPNRPRSKVDWHMGKPSLTFWRVIHTPTPTPHSSSATRQTPVSDMNLPHGNTPDICAAAPVVAHIPHHPALAPDYQHPSGTHTIVELSPWTGRSHQLRLHMQTIGHPIAGDTLYGDAANQAMAPRLLLHAWALELTHPITQRTMCWTCPTRFEH